MPMQAIIFDMDGVLIDSEPLYEASDSGFFENVGLTFGPEDREMLTGCSGLVVGKKMREKYTCLTQSEQELAAMYNASILKALMDSASLSLMAGAEEWMKAFSALGLRLAIASSSTKPMVYYVADRFNLHRFIDVIVTGDEVSYSKPWPDVYLEAARRLGVTPGECFAIEDSPNGIASAQSAGMRCAAFYATNRHALDLSRADYKVRCFDSESLNILMSTI